MAFVIGKSRPGSIVAEAYRLAAVARRAEKAKPAETEEKAGSHAARVKGQSPSVKTVQAPSKNAKPPAKKAAKKAKR